ncbi:hypothetical protein LOTGIDRAFT_163831 [Lottia gigantea]|uniref:Uncharacterized protein n=1 Tax=Lottia gigantea TaxID=225164 RepID=V4ABE8_LOTGI|nr:hypothetical protein LOTGIDRAFT_163831 [Lottia gigantea]ESO90631.1 hypothetical protein LOTGIDRAFT_163831 [Lottia gigantea]
MAQRGASDDNGYQNDRNGSFQGLNGLLEDDKSMVLGQINEMHNHKGRNRKQEKDNTVLAIQTYISPEGQSPFQHGTNTDKVVQDLDKPVGPRSVSKEKNRHVLSIQTYTSPESEQQHQHGIITHTAVSELDNTGSSNSKSKHKHFKSHKDRVSSPNGKESSVVAVQTITSPDGQPPFFKGKITNTVRTGLDKSEEHHQANNQQLTIDHSKCNKDYSDGQVLAIQTIISPEGQTPFQHSRITNSVVSELDNSGAHRENSNSISKNQHSKSSKDRVSSPNGKEDPVVVVQTITSPDGQPPFFKSKITNTVLTEFQKLRNQKFCINDVLATFHPWFTSWYSFHSVAQSGPGMYSV